MADVSFIFDRQKGYSDIKLVDGDVLLADELQTSVEMSMFTRARALRNPEPRVVKTIDALQGWWADALDDEQLGSLYWLYLRSKQTQEVLNGVSEAFEQSLQWLIDDGVASSVSVTNQWRGDNKTMDVLVQIVRPDESSANYTWNFAWESLNI